MNYSIDHIEVKLMTTGLQLTTVAAVGVVMALLGLLN